MTPPLRSLLWFLGMHSESPRWVDAIAPIVITGALTVVCSLSGLLLVPAVAAGIVVLRAPARPFRSYFGALWTAVRDGWVLQLVLLAVVALASVDLRYAVGHAAGITGIASGCAGLLLLAMTGLLLPGAVVAVADGVPGLGNQVRSARRLVGTAPVTALALLVCLVVLALASALTPIAGAVGLAVAPLLLNRQFPPLPEMETANR